MALDFTEKKDVSVLGKAKSYTDKKLTGVYFVMSAIVIICFLAFVQLLIDSFRFSSVTYSEYTESKDLLESLSESNKLISEESINNQKIIIEQQRQIQELLEKNRGIE